MTALQIKNILKNRRGELATVVALIGLGIVTVGIIAGRQLAKTGPQDTSKAANTVTWIGQTTGQVCNISSDPETGTGIFESYSGSNCDQTMLGYTTSSAPCDSAGSGICYRVYGTSTQVNRNSKRQIKPSQLACETANNVNFYVTNKYELCKPETNTPTPDPNPCIDSDGGQKFTIPGYVTKGNAKSLDNCGLFGEVNEMYCKNNNFASVTGICTVSGCSTDPKTGAGYCGSLPTRTPTKTPTKTPTRTPTSQPPSVGPCSPAFTADSPASGSILQLGSTLKWNGCNSAVDGYQLKFSYSGGGGGTTAVSGTSFTFDVNNKPASINIGESFGIEVRACTSQGCQTATPYSNKRTYWWRVKSTPTPTPDEKTICSTGGGTWNNFFRNSCVDSCEYAANPGMNCNQVITPGCDCGPSKCWDSRAKFCKANPVPPITHVVPSHTPTPTPTSQPPSVGPCSPAISSPGEGSILDIGSEIKWNECASAKDGYQLNWSYSPTGGSNTAIANSPFIFSQSNKPGGIDPGESFGVQVRACTSLGCQTATPWSTKRTYWWKVKSTPTPSPTPGSACSAPVLNGSAICTSTGEVVATWTWNNVYGATQYTFQRTQGTTFTVPFESVVVYPPNHSIQRTLPANTVWRGRVRVSASNQCSIATTPNWSNVIAIGPCGAATLTPTKTPTPTGIPGGGGTPTRTPTPTPGGVCIAPVLSTSGACGSNNNQMGVTWKFTKVQGAYEYRFQRDNNADFLSPEKSIILNSTTNTVTETLPGGQQWRGRVRVLVAAQCIAPSAWSNVMAIGPCGTATLTPTTTPTPSPIGGGSCKTNSRSCTASSQCCSGFCNSSGVCRNPVNTPTPSPTGGTTPPPTATNTPNCRSGGQTCSSTNICCSGLACNSNNVCRSPNVTSTPIPPSPTDGTTPPPGNCPAGDKGNLDCNIDGCIDTADYELFRQNFGSAVGSITVPAGQHTPDLVPDSANMIDTADYEILRANFGSCLP